MVAPNQRRSKTTTSLPLAFTNEENKTIMANMAKIATRGLLNNKPIIFKKLNKKIGIELRSGDGDRFKVAVCWQQDQQK
jgi:hypothetical protein